MKLGELIKHAATIAVTDAVMSDFDKQVKIRVWVQGKEDAIDFDIKAVYYDDIGETFIIDAAGRMGTDLKPVPHGWKKIKV